MTELRIDYQLLDEVRVRLEALAAEFERIQTAQDRSEKTAFGGGSV